MQKENQMKASEAFVKAYSKELSSTCRFDADALEMVIRNTLSSLSERKIRKVLPLIVQGADENGIGLFTAAEIAMSDQVQDLSRYASPHLAEAAKRLRAQLDAIPHEIQTVVDQINRMKDLVRANPPKWKPSWQAHLSRLLFRLTSILWEPKRMSSGDPTIARRAMGWITRVFKVGRV